jgi:hypothetical protein
VVRARGVDEHGLTGRLAEEGQRVVVDRQPAQAAVPQGFALCAGPEEGTSVRQSPLIPPPIAAGTSSGSPSQRTRTQALVTSLVRGTRRKTVTLPPSVVNDLHQHY